ncbi:LAMI_0E14180g1_1 [Lachancea mirantina]|uniref:LAMI_0E14180g1_1 n=1 Tax=Lachancea mirantina TaxID=1230905 RepID=A0A1G4JRD2_9SACH|nr:LAMI_0E14180g1_1 [Lachancea mirantina]
MSTGDPAGCVRCKEPLITGHAYELGGDRWHTHCFSCYKCDKPLSCDSNFLVLGTGALICFSCSDSCKNCGQKIDDLAIILATSNEAYCSDCFKCCKCGDKIENLRYAKTRRGLFCIRCHERLLERRKLYEEKKRRLKKELPMTPSEDSVVSASVIEPATIIEPAIPRRSAHRPLSPRKSIEVLPASTGHELEKQTLSSSLASLAAPLDFSAAVSKGMSSDPQSESSVGYKKEAQTAYTESVVGQFLLDTDYNSTGDEVSTEREDFRGHTSQLSIDDLLRTTLENDEHLENEASRELLDIPKFETKQLLNKTPLRNKPNDFSQKSPITNRQGLVLNEADVMEALNSPVRVGTHDEREAGLGITTPEKSEFSGGGTTMGLPYDSTQPVTAQSSSLDRNISRSPSLFGHHRRSSSGTNKKLGRSLSMRSKSIMMNLRPKSKDTKNAAVGKSTDFDTHSGWGVTSSSINTSGSQRRFSSKHQSDSTEYSTHKLGKGQHARSGSANGSVSVYRTPPLDTHSFSNQSSHHDRSLSLTAAQNFDEKEEEDIKTLTNRQFFEKDITELELILRRLKVEISELQSTKSQLTTDVESLRSVKEGLRRDIGTFEKEKSSDRGKSIESLEPDTFDESPVRQAATANVGNAAKPRFWKIFSSNKQGLNGPSLSVGRVEISQPVLQNPSDVSDLNLVPIVNKTESQSSSSDMSRSGHALHGSSLTSRCAFENNSMPSLISTCIQQIQSREEYLKAEGLYRKSGSQILIEQIESAFAQASPKDPQPESLIKLLNEDVHAVTGVLKRYLRRLPNPVLTYEVYEPLMKLVRDNQLLSNLSLDSRVTKQNKLYSETLSTLREILNLLPAEHLYLLKQLVDHLIIVSEFSDFNLMTLNNLSLVFAPGLIRDETGVKDISDMKERNYVVYFILFKHFDVFEN